MCKNDFKRHMTTIYRKFSCIPNRLNSFYCDLIYIYIYNIHIYDDDNKLYGYINEMYI